MGGTDYKEVAKKRRTSKNHLFKGNRYTKSIDQTEDDDSTSSKTTQEKEIGENAINDSSVSTPSTQGASSSASKIDFSFYSTMGNNAESGSDNPKTSSNMDTTIMYTMTDMKIFINLLQLVGQCPESSNAITTTVNFSSKKGLAQKVVLSCKNTTGCPWTYSTYTSTMIKNDKRSRYDVNIRSIIAFREIGRGLSHIETFHRIMNMYPPYFDSTFDDTVKDVLPHYIATIKVATW